MVTWQQTQASNDLSQEKTFRSPFIFPPKTGTDFFRNHFFQNALSCERKRFHQAMTIDIPNRENKPNFLPNFTISFESARNMRECNLVFFVGWGGYSSFGPSQVINHVITFRLVPRMKLFLEHCRDGHENKIPHRVNKANTKNHFLIQRGWVQEWNCYRMK